MIEKTILSVAVLMLSSTLFAQSGAGTGTSAGSGAAGTASQSTSGAMGSTYSGTTGADSGAANANTSGTANSGATHVKKHNRKGKAASAKDSMSQGGSSTDSGTGKNQ